MKDLLYYSNYCENSKKLLSILSKSSVGSEIDFICVDQRTQEPNGKVMIILANGFKVALPSTITKVPALLLPKHGYQVLFGDQIYQHLQPKEKQAIMTATKNQGEPESFALGAGNFGISSDNFCYLDIASEDLLAKGSGGMRQIHNYVTVDQAQNATLNIETPPDNYQPDKVSQGDYERAQNARNM